jgi:hypothetical protein
MDKKSERIKPTILQLNNLSSVGQADMRRRQHYLAALRVSSKAMERSKAETPMANKD